MTATLTRALPAHIVTDLAHLKSVVAHCSEVGAFSFDVETIGTDEETGADVRLDPRRAEVVWLSMATRGLAVTIPMGHPHGEQIGIKREPRVGLDGVTRKFKVPDWAPAPPQLRPQQVFAELEALFYDDQVEKSGHNIKYDLECIMKYYDNDVPAGPFFDTQVAAHALNENAHVYRLGDVVKRELGYTYDKSLGERIERYGFLAAAQYSYLDSKSTWLLRQEFRRRIERAGLDGMWALEMDVLEVLLYMEREGALLDVATAEKLYASLGRKRDELRGKLFRLAGREILLTSTTQMRDLLFGPKSKGGFGLRPRMLTKGGKDGTNKQASTAKEALELYQDHPFVETYLELQEVEKIHGTYLKAYLGGETVRQKGKYSVTEVKPSILIEGKVHANFKQHGTVTGRFSCSEPNLQNIPRPDTELGEQIRGMFIAPPGHSLVVADYAQIEYVVMAHFSRDPFLVRAFEDGVDVHKFVAAMVFGIDVDDVSKTQRTTAKNTNFAVAYGAGTDKVAAMSRITIDEAEAFRKAHKKMLPTLYRWTDRVVADCRRQAPPHVTTLLGRKRRLPGIRSSNGSARGAAERQAVNTRVQGSAADIIKLAMVRFHALADDDIRLALSVHDELVAVVPNDRIEDGEQVMRDAMLGDGIQSLLSVPMDIDLKVVQRWSEAKS